MNVLKKYLFLEGLALLMLLIVSCDRVENPVVINDTSLDWSLYPDADTSTYPWPTWTANANTTQNVLLEDFTGHTCTNCPAAATTAKGIEDANGGKVIVMSVHASTTSGFQIPEPPELPIDHRTEAGNEYAQAMGISFNPAGTVNRNIYGGDYYTFDSDWNNLVNAELLTTPEINLQCQYNHFPATNGLFIHTEVEALANSTDNLGLLVFLIRKHVDAAQKLQGGIVEEEYEHHNVLTDNINGTWGNLIFEGGMTSGSKEYYDFTYALPDPATDTTFNVDNLGLVTIAFDRDTYEIKQAIKTDLQ